jgi:hypothetical protein
MLLHWNFCIKWFDSNSKEDSKYFENALKYLKKEKEKGILFSSQLSAQISRQPTLAAARLLPRAWPSPTFSRLGRAQQAPAA